MIKAFLLDYDGVISVGIPDGTVAGRLSNATGMPLEQATKLALSFWEPVSKGKMTSEAVWQLVESETGKVATAEQRDIWFTWQELRPVPEMLALVRSLKTQGYPVGIVSNAVIDTAQKVREHGGYDEFDFAILSCEVGYRKPEPEIFQLAIDKLGDIQPDEIVYIDDREHHVRAATELGMHGIVVKNPADAISRIKLLLNN